MCQDWIIGKNIVCDLELSTSYPSCVSSFKVLTRVFHKWNFCSYLKSTSCMDYMQTAIIYIGMLFQIFQFAVIETSFSIVCAVPTKLRSFYKSSAV
jgi:hypothetical protein